jgi:uncharacterized SAM-binding protein YcdF (DUF218 family)
MFLLKKALKHFLLPPGIFVVVLICSGVWYSFKKYGKAGLATLATGTVLWTLSTAPVSYCLMNGLESGVRIPSDPRGDVIILLGGGIYRGVDDFSGEGAPSEKMLARIVTAVRLQKKLNIPVIVSGGAIFPWEQPEASVDKRFLVDLGVPADKVLIEDRSRDTMENARYAKEICDRLHFTKPLLVTSAFHMNRAAWSFKKLGMHITPYPANYHTGKQKRFTWLDYLPGSLDQTTDSISEYLGLLLYKMLY